MLGSKALRLTARWAKSRLVPHVIVLGYHRIADDARDPHAMCVAPDRFVEHMEVLRRHAEPLALRTLVAEMRHAPPPRRAVVVTFDDGYADNLHTAKPILERFEIPATVFLTTGCPGGEFWWDSLTRAVTEPTLPPLRLDLPDGALEWQPDGAQPGDLLMKLQQALEPMAGATRAAALDDILAWAGANRAGPGDARSLTRGELDELIDGGLVDLGAHSVTHPALTVIAPAELRFEIETSRAAVEAVLGDAPAGFSYPHGRVSDEVAAAVRDAGFACACTSTPDVVTSRSSPYRLPRFWVPDCDGDQFSRWLLRWLHA